MSFLSWRTGRRALAGLALLLSLAGCDKEKGFREKEAAQEAELRPAIQQTEERVEKARQAALAKPELKPASGWSGPPLVAINGSTSDGNAVVMIASAGMCEDSLPKTEPFRLCGANPFCTRRQQRQIPVDFKKTSADELERMLQRKREGLVAAGKMRYAIFVETLEYQRAKLHANSFTGGVYRGEARVFDLESGQYLGGFDFRGESDQTISFKRTKEAKSALVRDFRDNVQRAFNKALSTFTGSPSRMQFGDQLEWD